MNVYSGRLEMRHFDLYRIKDSDELYNTGFGEYCGGDGLTVIEWGELFIDELPEEYLHIKIELEGAGRRFVFEPHGARYEKLCGGSGKKCWYCQLIRQPKPVPSLMPWRQNFGRI